MSATHFGYRTVSEDEKTSLVRGVFDTVASRYDIMNDAMSFGAHRLWKREFVSRIDLRPDMVCLDVAGGTGDIAFKLKQRGAQHIVVCDINQRMLEEGLRRADDRNMASCLEWLCGNAETLPFTDNAFHLYTIAFGIRNVTHIAQALAEAHRVLMPGGRFMCLEFSQVESSALARAYDAFSFHVIPKMGKLIAGDSEPYRYLVESIRTFPDQRRFAGMIREAGFAQVSYRNLSGGVVAIHSGYKL